MIGAITVPRVIITIETAMTTTAPAKPRRSGWKCTEDKMDEIPLELDLDGILTKLRAAEQRAAEAEGLLRTVEDKLVPMMNFLDDNKLEYSVYWRDASPNDGAYVKCKVAEWQNLEEAYQAAAKWLETHDSPK